MIVVMKPGATREQVQHAAERGLVDPLEVVPGHHRGLLPGEARDALEHRLADQPADWGPAKPSAQIAPAPVVSSKKDHEWPFSQFSRRGEFHPGRK